VLDVVSIASDVNVEAFADITASGTSLDIERLA
jgi:hypothetical protein